MFTFIFALILIVSLIRGTGKRFDVAYGARGCLVTGICMLLFQMAVMALFSLGLTNWQDLIPDNAQKGLFLLMWFTALCLGGYHAARLGRTTGWTNSLIVGMFAESFLLAMLLDKLIEHDFGLTITISQKLDAIYEKPWAYWGRLPGRLFDHLIEMLQEQLTNWGQLAGLFFAIPVAVLGGVVWQRSHPNLPQLPPNTGPHKQVTLMNTILGLLFPILGLVFLCLLVLAITFYDEPAVVKAIKDRGGIVKGDPVVSVAFPSSASVSDVDLKVLKELTTLKTLNLDSTNITDEGLKELKELKELKNLRLLNLTRTKITDAGLKELQAALPGTRIISE